MSETGAYVLTSEVRAGAPGDTGRDADALLRSSDHELPVDGPVDLEPGTVQTAEISAEGELDLYEICADAGDTIVFTMVRQADSSETSLDPLLMIYTQDVEPLGSDDDGAGGLDSQLTFHVPVDGCYLVVAADLFGLNVGAYTLTASPE